MHGFYLDFWVIGTANIKVILAHSATISFLNAKQGINTNNMAHSMRSHIYIWILQTTASGHSKLVWKLTLEVFFFSYYLSFPFPILAFEAFLKLKVEFNYHCILNCSFSMKCLWQWLLFLCSKLSAAIDCFFLQ